MQPISLILASSSPRRHELLTQLGFQVQKQPADIDETRQNGEAPEDYVARLAVEKNRVVAAQSPDMPVVSADTCVVLGDEILGKPESPEHARQMLRQLSRQTHRVLTGVCVSLGGRTVHCVQVNEVRFKPLSEEEISAYLSTGEPFDKAGGYGIQGIAGCFVAHLSGSFTGVMGLPVFETVQLLQQCGIALPDILAQHAVK